MERQQQQQQPPRRGNGGGGMPSSFWKYGPFSGGNACTDGPMACGDDDYENEDDSIVEKQQRHPASSAQQQQLPPEQRVRNLVDGFLSPFMNCVQPPLQACVAPAVVDWDPAAAAAGQTSMGSSRFHRQPYSLQSSSRSSSRSAAVHNTPPTTRPHSSCSSSSLRNSIRCGEIGLESSSSPSFSAAAIPTPTTTSRAVPNDNDVLCGRGNSSNRHAGNIHFRDLISANKVHYGTLTKKEKMLLARHIVDLVLHHTDPPARFLGRDAASGLWYDIGLPRSLEKTSQALREKSAASKACAAEKAGSICSVPSFDGSVSEVTSSNEGIEVTSGEGKEDEAAAITALCRASTAKITNQRNNNNNNGIEPSRVKIPEHLRKVYGHRPPPPPPPPVYLQTPPLSAELQHRYYAGCSPQHRFGGVVVVPPAPPPPHHQQQQQQPPRPIHPAFRPSQQQQQPPLHPYNDHQSHHQHHPHLPVETTRSPYPPPPLHHHNGSTALPLLISSPPRSGQQQQQHAQNYAHSTSLSASSKSALVTPHGHYDDYPQQQQEGSYASSSRQQSPHLTQPDRNAPVFPVDVFQNPDYCFEQKTTIDYDNSNGGFRERPHQRSSSPGDQQFSPTREQKPKRQRTSETAANLSTEESLTELNTTGDSNESYRSCYSTSRGLNEAIATQLTLEDRVIRSPSELTQSFAGGRRRSQQPLPRPAKSSSTLDISADSMDGLAALSTAAFLRLDESF